MARPIKPTESKRDFREELTNNIIALIEKGCAPWQRPWDSTKASQALQMPHNATTGRPYRGANTLNLMAKAYNLNVDNDPRWLTYKQALDKGWQVKKGSKGTGVEYWKFEGEKEVINDKGEKEKLKYKLSAPHVFYATVFHASQIEGIPSYAPKERDELWNPIEEAEKILTNSGAKIYHDQQDKAYYSPGRDDIHLPPKEGFSEPLKYYEVAMHELGHWTGHESRLARDLTGGFGSESYAKEELRAQMASLYLSADTGVPFNPQNHAAYQASWIKVLKNDKNEIFKAAKDAELIADYVIGLSHSKEIAQTIPTPTITTVHSEISILDSEQVKAEAAKVMEIVLAKLGKGRSSAAQDYKLEAQKIIKETGSFPGQSADEKIVQALFLKGHQKSRISDAIKKNSPGIVGKNPKETSEYLKQTILKSLTPQIQKQIRAMSNER